MDELISPKYQMSLINSLQKAIWDEYKSYKEVESYIEKWQFKQYDSNYFNHDNFSIRRRQDGYIDLTATLHGIEGTTLLKIAIDLGVDTPDFIPSIPTFKNELKSDYKTAYDTFTKAYKQIETDPSMAIALANSTLESIIKEILKDDKLRTKIDGKETLYKLAILILKEFNISDEENPIEIKTIGSKLLAICQSIEKIRSEKTNAHGKTNDDILIEDEIYTYFIINSVTTVGLFLISYYKTKYPKQSIAQFDDLPF
jgi:hypothetical protein